MSSCPNPNAPEWKALVAALGNEADAMTAYKLNGFNIPDYAKAREILNKLEAEEKDEQISRSADAKKLQRAQDQHEHLKTILARANPAQRATLETVMQMNVAYQEFLMKNLELARQGLQTISTVSVSNFIGSSDFKGDPTKYEAFKLFGTFMHEVLEKAQVRALATGRMIDQILTPEYFQQVYDEYTAKTPFEIEELTVDNMYRMATRIALHVSVNNDKGYVILPEITVTGMTKTGSMIIGRLDLMLIDSEGKVNIFDFKTKKVKGSVDKDPVSGEEYINGDKVMVHLANQKFPIEPKAGTSQSFQGKQRTAYDTWTLQLKVYENIMRQHGIDVGRSSILGLMYETDEDGVFKDAMFHVFDIENFYNYAKNAVVPGDNGIWKTDPVRTARQIEELKKAVDEEIPTSEAEQEKMRAKEVKILDFSPTSENNEQIALALKASIDKELSEIQKQISEIDKNDKGEASRRELLVTRRRTLNDFLKILERTDDSSKGHSINFSLVMDSVEADLTEMEKLSNAAIEEYRKSTDKRSALAQLTQVRMAFSKSRGMYEIVSTLKEIVNEARANNPGLDTHADVMKKLNTLNIANEAIEANFREAGLANAVIVTKTVGEKAFMATKEQLEEGIIPRLELLRKKYEALKLGKASGIFTNLKSSMLSFMSQDYKDKLAAKLGPGNTGLMDEAMALEMQIKKLEAYLQYGLDYSDDAIAKYITGVTDPTSDVFIGATDIFNNSAISGLGQMIIPGGNLIAAASDSEIAVSSYAQMFKNAQAQAIYNMQNDMIALDFDKMRDKLLSRMSIEQLNEMLSEWRTVKWMDPKTGEMKEKRQLYMAKPFSEEYEQTFRSYSSNMRAMNNEIYTARTAFNEAFAEYSKAIKAQQKNPGDASLLTAIKEKEVLKDEAQKVLLTKVREKEVENDKYMQWLQDNTSLPYNDDFYKLQQMLPQDIRDELQKKYLEIQVITHQVGSGNEILLEDHDFDRLKELDTEIRKLREEAKKRNPDYADYMDKFNSLFEFDVNTNFFDRMYNNAKTRYADHPEMWQKWLKDNTIERPTQEWYDELADLYEQRAEIYGSNPLISDLMDRRREIMRPHKVAGRFNPQFLSADEIDELDAINADIEDIIAATPKTKLPKAIRTKAAAIGDKIKSISEKRISGNYMDLFDKKFAMLEGAYRLMIQSENQLATARAKGDATTIKKATKDMMFYAGQFDIVESDFEEWYNNNHTNEYKSIMKGNDVRGNAVPKSFNFETLPASAVYDKYMDIGVPHPKFNIKRLKESAKNPNYLQSADGIPMPKGVVQTPEGHYMVAPGFEGSKNISQKYKDIMKDPEVFNFYNKMMDMFLGLQKKVEGRKVGYMVPGYAASLVENIASEGMFKAFGKQWEKYVDKSVNAYGEQDRVNNTFGDLGGRIRMRYTEQLSENLQTKDAVGALIKYALEANYNIAMQEVAPMADAHIEYLELLSEDLKKKIQAGKTFATDPVTGEKRVVDMSKRQRELDIIIDQMKFERRKFAYGQEESDNPASRVIRKRMNQIFAYTSFIRMGFDAANQMKNFFSGNVQTWIAAGNHSSDHYSRSDMMWAKSKIYGYNGFLQNYFTDWDKVSDLSDSTLLYRVINPLQKDFTKYVSEVTSGRGRKAAGKLLNVQEIGYMLQDKGDTEVGLTVMYAVMNRYKFKVIDSYDAEGNAIYKKDSEGKDVMVSAHEAYARDKKGMLSRRPDVEYSLEDENRLRNIIYSEIRRAQGNYSSSDMTKFEETVVGKLAFFYRKYLVPQLLNRFGYLRPNWEAGEAALGYWRAVNQAWKFYGPSHTLKHFVLGSKLAKKFGSEMDMIEVLDPKTGQKVKRQGSLYSRKIDHARRDAFVIFLMWALGMMVMSYVRRKDEDEEELGMLEGNAIRILFGVKGETMSMFPLGSGSEEYIRNFTSLTVYTRELTAIQKLGSHSWNLTMAMMYNGGDEPDPDMDGELAYQTWKDAFYTRKSGRYEEGDAKIIKDLEDMTGIRNFKDIFDPQYRVDQLKKNQ